MQTHETGHQHLMANEGINHLTTDNMIYNLLVDAQQNDDLLNAFVIKFMDSHFVEKIPSQEKNVIYVVRQESVVQERLYDSQSFEATIDVIIQIREYDTVTAQRILKTMYKDVMHHIVNDETIDYLRVVSVQPEYVEPGRLDKYIITFAAHEVENFCYDYDPEPVRIALGIRTSIEGTNEVVKKLKPMEVHYGK